MYVFKIQNSQAPGYLTELLSYYNPTRCLRSSSVTTRLVLRSSATAIGDKRFQIVAAKSWNLLPTEIRTRNQNCHFYCNIQEASQDLSILILLLLIVLFVFFLSAMVLW